MSSLLSFQIRQQEQNNNGLPLPPNSFCGQVKKEEPTLQTIFHDMSLTEYSMSLPDNYTIDHSKKSSISTAGTGGLRIRHRKIDKKGLSKSFNSSCLVESYRCIDCGKSYKSSACLQKHRWEHSKEWELTKTLPLTKHQQVQMLEAAAILIGFNHKLKVEKEESIVVDDDNLSILSNDSFELLMDDL